MQTQLNKAGTFLFVLTAFGILGLSFYSLMLIIQDKSDSVSYSNPLIAFPFFALVLLYIVALALSYLDK